MLTSIVGERIFLAEEDAFCWGAWRWALAAESSSSMSRPRGTNSDGKNRRTESAAARRGCRRRLFRLIAPPRSDARSNTRRTPLASAPLLGLSIL